MRVGIRTALIVSVPAAFVLTTGAVNVLWSRTAQSNSRSLVDTLNQQTVTDVRNELSSLIASAEAAHRALNTILVRDVVDVREPDKREFLFLAQLQAQPALSWISLARPDGSFFAVHKLDDSKLEVVDIAAGPDPRSESVDTYRTLAGMGSVQQHAARSTGYDVTQQPWYRDALASPTPLWTRVSRHAEGDRPSIAYVGRVAGDAVPGGVLAVMIDLDRLSRFLAGLTVGRTGAAFVLDANGAPVAGPAVDAGDARMPVPHGPALLGVARQTHDRMLAKADPLRMQISAARVASGGQSYTVSITPLDFMGWQVTTVVPEADFLGGIDAATRRIGLSLVALVVAAVTVAALLARFLLVVPLTRMVGQLGRVRRFDLDQIDYHPTWLSELDRLSFVLSNMASGLRAFRKYLPADLVNMLVQEGVEAKPGGTVRPMTILFIDLEGFTGLSERMGNAAIPLLSRYIALMSDAIVAHGGTIDKFIGDAIMAFWGAPEANPNQEADACRAALACSDALMRSDVRDDRGRPLRARIGINSGDVLVGNIGTEQRLNYTVLGDAVNVASRLEAANKVYGTTVIIGDGTRRRIGTAFLTRELDRVTLPGRTEGTKIHELIGPAEAGAAAPDWVSVYEDGLACYGAARFTEAAARFTAVDGLREGDAASLVMLQRCRSKAAGMLVDGEA